LANPIFQCSPQVFILNAPAGSITDLLLDDEVCSYLDTWEAVSDALGMLFSCSVSCSSAQHGGRAAMGRAGYVFASQSGFTAGSLSSVLIEKMPRLAAVP